ncbi:hypothetical protein Tco_0347497 [Tanacetum coccineum]
MPMNHELLIPGLEARGVTPEVPESVPMSLTTVPVVMKPVQSMSSSVTPVRRYGNPASGKLGHSSIDPLEGLGAAVELSPTSYLDVGAVRHKLLRGGNLASGMSSLRSTGDGMNSKTGSGGSGNDGNGNDMGTCGGKCSDDGGGGSGGMDEASIEACWNKLNLAYKLGLPQELSRVHNTFHVSNLRKYYADEPLAVPLDELHFDDKLRFVEKPAEIMDREVQTVEAKPCPNS